MLPHAGPDSRIFREVTQTGEAVARLAEPAGSTVTASVAVLDDPDAMWALEVDGPPSARLHCHAPLAEAHRALWDAGVHSRPTHLLTDPPLALVANSPATRARVSTGSLTALRHPHHEMT